jgi:hypothetical protein
MMSSSDRQEFDDQLLIRYLLGALTEAETERLDELSIAGDEFASRLEAVENDLVDAYANGELSGETLERFNSVYLASENRREKVRFAETFQVLTDRAASAWPKRAPVARRPWSVLGWGFAAAACLLLLAGVYLLADNLRLRNQVMRAEAARAALQQRQEALSRQLEEQLRATAVIPPADRESGRSEPPGTFALVLLPQTRSSSPLPAIAVLPGAERADFQLQLESDDFPAYQLALKDLATARIIWRSGRLKAASGSGAKIVSVSLPARLLKAQNYGLELTGIPANGVPQYMSSYAFASIR